METLQRTANRGSVSTGYDIDNSLKLEDDNTENLYRALNGSTSTTKFTVSMWFKRTELGATQLLYMRGVAGNEAVFLRTSTEVNDALQVDIGASSTNSRSYTSQLLRDTSAWYHVVLAVDTTQSTATDRFKLYLNGNLITDFASRNNPAEDFAMEVSSAKHRHGAYNDTDGFAGYCGYIAECHYVDGSQVAQTEFGEFDDDTGIWKPKAYTGSYGTGGYYLDFSDSSALGNNSAGDGTDFTLNNISAADQATDTPTNNFCTWSPLWAEPRANGTISEGATQVAWGGNAWKIARSSIAVSKGRWYWEIKGANVTGDTWNNNLFGFASTESDGQTGPSVLLGYSTGNYYYRVAGSQTGQDNFGNAGGAWSSSDTFAIALDLESSTKKFILYRNGSAVNGTGTDLVSAFQTEQFFTAYATAYNGDTQFLNWGGYTVNTISSAASDENGYGTFEYAPPSGYYAICTKNLALYGGTA